MTNSMPSEQEIKTFVDGGSTPLANYVFESEELNKKPRAAKPRALMAAPDGPGGDTEQSVFFRLNQTGNIFYKTTSKELSQTTKDLFDSVTVLLTAMTVALNSKKKDLFDYEAWGSVIRQSGYFLEVQKMTRQITIEKTEVTIDTQIVQQLLPGLKSGDSMEIAKGVLSALSGKYSGSSVTETSKFAHLLFICEELFGAPSITVRLFYATKGTHTTLVNTPCTNVSTQKIQQKQEADTFLFVDPKTIAKFAGTFAKAPKEYEELITKLSGYIK